MRRRSRFSSILRVSVFALVLFGAGFLTVFAYQNLRKNNDTQALSATEFQAGRIIDDSIFYNPNTMTAAEIDAFIDSHSPECDMWGNGRTNPMGIVNKEYARIQRENGSKAYHEPPYVCVSEYYENPETHQTNFDTNGKRKPGMLSAGEIIYEAAQEYSINPQVLLVMLKKESYAWGDDWPLRWEYKSVMGYACPDGAPCDEKYSGFYNQVMMAAWQLNYYREHIYSYNYRPYATNNILYNPDRSCGSKPVYLENLATTSLYIYTPYVPNDAALRNYPGTSYCGSYGNRNFYMYFREWFGDTLERIEYRKIAARYKALGGEKGVLGEKIGDPIENRSTGIIYQQYENGFIVGSNQIGFWESMGETRNAWARDNWAYANLLGYPAGPIETNAEGITYQKYERGYIIGSDKLGYWESTGKIRNAWAKDGWKNATLLGYPTGPITKEGNLYSQEYEKGYIIGSDKTGYWESLGKIRDAWLQNKNSLGYPTSSIETNKAGISFQKYENGYIVGSDKLGYWESMGEIREAWASNGWKNAEVLGYPTGPITKSGSLYSQEYEKGFIVGSSKTGYWESTGGIREAWLQNKNSLGYPTSSIETNKAGISFQKYENGYVVGSEKLGYWESMGEIREAWASNGWKNAEVLGYPTGPIVTNGDTISQSYEHGSISIRNNQVTISY